MYGDRLASILDGRLDPGALAAAQDSVGVADALGSRIPQVTSAMQSAFLDGLSAGCLVIGGLCLVGAVAALLALPGRGYVHPEATTEEARVGA